MLIDAHAHVNFNVFKNDAPEVIRRALDNDTWLINIGSQFATSQRAVEIATEYEKGVYACVGLHPIHLSDVPIDEDEDDVHFTPRHEEFNHEAYFQLAQNKKVVGIGECGLDYYYLENPSHPPLNRGGKTPPILPLTGEGSLSNSPPVKGERPPLYLPLNMGERPPLYLPLNKGEKEGVLKDKQKEVFIEHIKLAKELNLPLMLHCRGSKNNPEDAYEDMLEILQEQQKMSLRAERSHAKGRSALGGQSRTTTGSPRSLEGSLAMTGARGMIHCFGSNLKIAKQFVDLGFYVGFTGIVTFPNAKQLQEVARELPLDKIITETDCPYLAPAPMRGKRNEPMYVKYVVAKIAELKNLPVEEVAKATFGNALKLFEKIR